MAGVRLTVPVPSPGYFTALGYTLWEWERSETVIGGAYYPLTAAAVTSAILTGTGVEAFALDGLELKIEVNGSLDTITFFGGDPWSAADVAVRCNAIFSAATAADDGTGKLKITNDGTGTGNTLKILNGTANAVLGFTENQHDWGLDEYPALTAATSYIYRDLSGIVGYWYRYRFRKPAGSFYTQWSNPYQAVDVELLDAADLCLCSVDLVNPDGTAMENCEILVTNPLLVGNLVLVGTSYVAIGPRISFVTDAEGHGEVSLIRNNAYDISVEGTGLVRRITVPDAATANLLDPALGTDDLFEVQEFEIPGAIRRTP